MAQKYPKLARLLAGLALALLIGGGLAAYQWSQHVGRRRQDEAALLLDRQLGLTVEQLDDDTASGLGAPSGTTGLVVTSLADGRPADRAGLEAGDIIEQIDNFAVTNPQAAADALHADRRRQLILIVNRHGREVRIEVTRG